jgi:hypothetical protein
MVSPVVSRVPHYTSSLVRTSPPPSRLSDFPLSPVIRFPSPPISRRGEEGFSSCLAHPCHRAAAATPPKCPVASVSLRRAMLPSPHEERLGLWNSVSRLLLHSLVAARCLAHHPFDGFVDRLSGFGFPPPDYPSYRVLTFTLVGLFPPLNAPAFAGHTFMPVYLCALRLACHSEESFRKQYSLLDYLGEFC